VKIYSNRVDDTYNASHRILENLSRKGGNSGSSSTDRDDDDDEVDDDDTNAGTTGKPKTKSSKSGNRFHMTNTIEKNHESLNAVKVEHEYSFDPLFQKLSNAFDDGGAKGMLLYNMVTTFCPFLCS
jgi:condensin complex subunit 2